MTSAPEDFPVESNDIAASESPHYVEAVGRLAESHHVIAHRDIFAQNGVKLVAEGRCLTAEDISRLLLHKLRVSLDVHLTVEHSINGAALALEASRQLQQHRWLMTMLTRCGDPLGLQSELAALPLSPALQFRLTVMARDRPALFGHCVRVAAICFAVSTELKLDPKLRPSLLIAGILHDIGELHTSPELLAAELPLTSAQRRQIEVHPLTGYLVLKHLHVDARVCRLVLQHHERLDGTGYPHGRTGPSLDIGARILAVAEMTDALARDTSRALQLDVLLRTDQRRFDASTLHAVRTLLGVPAAPAPQCPESLTERLTSIVHVINDWPSVSSQLAPGSQARTLRQLMATIRSSALQAGIDLLHPEVTTALIAEQPEACAEISAVIAEITWSLREFHAVVAAHDCAESSIPDAFSVAIWRLWGDTGIDQPQPEISSDATNRPYLTKGDR